jgi:thiamine-phosphate pyrophosphorylase
LLLYYITDRTQFAGDEGRRRHGLLEKVAEAALYGVDFVQLREKDLAARELENLARAAMRVIRENSPKTRLLINSRSDVALACGADGVHLRSDDISPRDIRSLWTSGAEAPAQISKLTSPAPVISVSCHSVADVARAAADEADFALFAPVFQKRAAQPASGAGIDMLHSACQQGIRVLALGGVTPENARACADAGAAGVAGIRLFQENNIAQVVQALRV